MFFLANPSPRPADRAEDSQVLRVALLEWAFAAAEVTSVVVVVGTFAAGLLALVGVAMGRGH